MPLRPRNQSPKSALPGLVPGIHALRQRQFRTKGDRGREGLGLPSLRTVRAVLPHTALRLLVSSSGMSRVIPGCGKGEQPEIGEEGVGPALVIVGTAAEAWPLFLLAQDGSQPSSDEAVQMAMNGRRGLLEVAEPSPKQGVAIVDDPPHARAPAAAGHGAHFVLERAQALLAHQPTAGFEPVAEEVKPLPRFATVADPRLVRLQP